MIADKKDGLYPSAGYGWFLVVMLTLAYILSYIDRSILSLLIEPIKEDLKLSDEQIGLIFGPAFGLLYVGMGIPIGWLVDRARRTWIISTGMIVWSVATAASGLATSFWQLFGARMVVGTGEAALSPSAMSIIGDSFPPERRAKPIAIYTAALSIGASMAYFIGGGVLVWAKSTKSVEIPIVGAMAPWQLTFVAVGLPGIALAVAFLFLKDPVRVKSSTVEQQLEGNGFRDAFKYLSQNFWTYATLLSLCCVMTIIAYSQYFLPSVFSRTWGWEPEKYAFINATGLLIFGPIPVFLTGYIADRWSKSGVKDASFRLLVIGFLLMVPTSIISMFMPSPVLAYGLICINTVGIGMISAMGITSVMRITPTQIRGQVVAVYYMTISLAGLFLGSSTVGTLSTRFFGEDNLNLAMAALPVIYGTIPLLLIPIAHRLYTKKLNEFE